MFDEAKINALLNVVGYSYKDCYETVLVTPKERDEVGLINESNGGEWLLVHMPLSRGNDGKIEKEKWDYLVNNERVWHVNRERAMGWYKTGEFKIVE